MAIQTIQERYTFSGSEAAAQLFAKRSAVTHAEYLMPSLKQGMAVVDVGCAGGQITVGFAEAVAPAQVLGIDTDEGAIERARALAADRSISNVRFDAASAYEIPVEDESVDVVHFHAVLSHLAEPGQALAEAMRVLKPGGLLAAREPDKSADFMGGPYADAMERLNQLYMDDWKLGGGDPSIGRRLKSVVLEAGFDLIETGAVFDWADMASTYAMFSVAGARIKEASFRERAVASGICSIETFEWLDRSLEARSKEAAAFQAFAEVEVLARKV